MAGLDLMMRVKSFFGYTIAGIAFVVVSGLIFTMLSMAFGIGASGIATVTDLATAFVNLEPLGIGIGFISFFILGALVWVFGIIGVKIRRALGAKDVEISFDKRPALLGFFLAGIVAVIIFAGLSAILNGITQDPTLDLTDIMTLFDAILAGDPLLFLGALVGLSVIGFLVIKIAKIEKSKLSDPLPEKAKFGEG